MLFTGIADNQCKCGNRDYAQALASQNIIGRPGTQKCLYILRNNFAPQTNPFNPVM
jgi:hypothetical protein